MSYAATIGFFDGVHSGHRFVVERLKHIALKTGLQAAIVTFSEHPQKVLTGAELPLLTTFNERISLLKQLHVDEIFAFNFEIIREMTAEEFMRILHNQCGVELLLMGYDHRFGSDRLTNPEDYQRLADNIGLELVFLPAAPLEMVDGKRYEQSTEERSGKPSTSSSASLAPSGERVPHTVRKGLPIPSSTKIRKALLAGLVEEANEMLGYPYSLSGEVVEGRHLGRTIGFPTANINVAEEKLIPVSGVYAATIDDDELGFAERPVLVNIGSNPTVGGRKITVEAHIPDWDGDLYGHRLTVKLQRYIRAEKKFPSMDALKDQIHKDKAQVLAH